MYSEKILNLFANPHNVGIVNSASGVGQYTNEETNEIIKLYIKLEGDMIVDTGFKIYSGVAGIALMSVYTDLLKNKKIEDALQIEAKDLALELELDGEHKYLYQDAIEAFKLALEDHKERLEKEQKKKKK